MLAPPTRGSVSSPFGWRRFASRDDYHTGVDYIGAKGAPIRAVASGVVARVAPNGSISEYGNVVVIKHDNPQVDGPYSLYAHLNTINARQGQRVYAGKLIGTMGNTAASRTDATRVVPTHLHFELLNAWPPPGKDAGRLNPNPYFTAAPSYSSYSAPYLEPQSYSPYLYDQNYTPASGSFSGIDWKDIGLGTATAIVGLGLVAWNIRRSMQSRSPLPRRRR